MADAVRRATTVGRIDEIAGSVGIASLYQVFTAELVNGTADVESLPAGTGNGFRMQDYRYFGVWVKLAGTTPNVVLRILQSFDDTAANYVVIESGGSPITLTDTNAHVLSINPVPMRFIRFRLDGQTGNGTDVTADMYLWAQT